MDHVLSSGFRTLLRSLFALVMVAFSGCPSSAPPAAGKALTNPALSEPDIVKASGRDSQGSNASPVTPLSNSATVQPAAPGPTETIGRAKSKAASDPVRSSPPSSENTAPGPAIHGEARLGTFYTSTGETYFALSLFPNDAILDPRPRQVVILFDTSASQTGVYRDDAIAALEAFLSGLADWDRVKLWALDIEVVPLTTGFVSPDDEALQAAVEQLRRRLPLGATDLRLGLETAMVDLDNDHAHAHRVAYIGDGISRANLLEMEEFGELVERLGRQRISVASFAIGPQLDVEVLATLANHTGGMVHVDAPELSAQQSGLALARTVSASVFWPEKLVPPVSFGEVFPARTPPLSSERDTILIGEMIGREQCTLELSGTMGDRVVKFGWSVMPEAPSDEFAFLPYLFAQARPSQGLSLATVGSAGLREVVRVMTATAEELIAVGEKALGSGDLKGALTSAESVLKRDPKNPQALAIKRAVERQSKGKPGGEK